MRHQSPVRSRARSEYFYARAVRVQLHTRVFLKFKSSCTVRSLWMAPRFSQWRQEWLVSKEAHA